ncbi:Zinc finger, CCHC-type-like protein [Gossypium australe]|uniref:Zinc finger, CCHC-type-like protein n=1 Tax=Gossypium australe TaxID=47621 RepID=A0A5B6WIF7_9ROSI|nr:Zinc finger, CCHC-type-like protein [Gossypium australe]
MMEKVRRRCGFENGIEVEAEGSRGGLCMAWKKEISVRLRSFSRWHIDVFIKEDNVEEEWRYTGFYGSPYSEICFEDLLKRLTFLGLLRVILMKFFILSRNVVDF